MPLVLLLFALPFLVVRLDWWPVTWFDEGVFLSGAKNIALYGRYATLSGGEFSQFDPILTGAGPPLLVPVAFLFRLFGVGLVQGRIVSVFYALAAIALSYALSLRVMRARAAIIATALMIWAPWGDFASTGRFAMGEMASLAFILAGVYLWWRSVDGQSIGWSLGCGVAFGLALLVKPQNGLILFALALVGALDWIYYRRLGWRRWTIPLLLVLVCYGGWQAYQAAVLGSSEWFARLQMGDTASRALATLYRPSLILANFNNLAQTGYLLWAVPALVYFGSEVLYLRREGVRELLLFSLVSIWLLWYVLASVGWVRYAFVPIALSSLLLARLFGDATDDFRFGLGALTKSGGTAGLPSAIVRFSLGLLPLMVIGYGMLVDLDGIVREGSSSAQEMAAYLNSHVEGNALVETWQWEISLLSQRTFHHPPFDVLETAVRQIQLGIPPQGEAYSPEPFEPDYVVDGPFSKWTGLYSEYLRQHCVLRTSIGMYDLYRCSAQY